MTLGLIIGFVWLVVFSFVGILFHKEKKKPKIDAPQGREVTTPVADKREGALQIPSTVTPTQASQTAQSGTSSAAPQSPESNFSETGKRPQSSFPLKVDPTSMENLKRFLNHYKMPPPSAVHPSSMVNSQDYKYDRPGKNQLFAITIEVSACPWNPGNKLAVIGLQAKDAPQQNFMPNDKTNFVKQGAGYVDNLLQTKDNLAVKLSETHLTIAEDAWVLVDFEPGSVQSYRLVGYENRADAKPRAPGAGPSHPQPAEFESGRAVTALYEIIPVEKPSSQDFLSVTLRYRELAGSEVKFLAKKIRISDITAVPSDRFVMAAGAAEFGLLLLNSPYMGQANYGKLISRLKALKSADPDGSRADFIRLIETAQNLSSR